MSDGSQPGLLVTWGPLVKRLGHRFRVSCVSAGPGGERYERRWQCGCVGQSGDLGDGPQRYSACRTHRDALLSG